MHPSTYSLWLSCHTKSETENKKWKAIQCWQIIYLLTSMQLSWGASWVRQRATGWWSKPGLESWPEDGKALPSTKTGSARRQSKPSLLRSAQTSEGSREEGETLFSRGDIERSTRGTLWWRSISFMELNSLLASLDGKLKHHRDAVCCDVCDKYMSWRQKALPRGYNAVMLNYKLLSWRTTQLLSLKKYMGESSWTLYSCLEKRG